MCWRDHVYSETCSCDHLYSTTTSIQGPLGCVPIVALQCIFTSIKRPPLFKDLFLAQAWSLTHRFQCTRDQASPVIPVVVCTFLSACKKKRAKLVSKFPPLPRDETRHGLAEMESECSEITCINCDEDM